MFMCESVNQTTFSVPPFFAFARGSSVLLFLFFLSMLVVVGDTRVCKSSSAVGYRCIMMSRSRLSNFSYSAVQDPQFSLKIDHEARVTRHVVAFWDMRHTGENTLGFRSDREWNQSNIK